MVNFVAPSLISLVRFLSAIPISACFCVPRLPAGLLALAGLLSLAAASRAAEPGQKSFDISADVAERALKRFAAQASLEVLLPTDIARGVQTNAIKGEFYPLEAVNRMLANTRLFATQVESTGAIVVGHKEIPATDEPNPRGASDSQSSAKKKRQHP